MAPHPVRDSAVVKLLYLLDSLAPGGAETSTVLLAGALVARGHDCTIATLDRCEGALAERAVQAGVQLRDLSGASLPSQIIAINRLVRSERFDVLHTALYRSDVAGRLAQLGTKAATISSFVSTPYVPERLQDLNVPSWKLAAVRWTDRLTGKLVDQFHAVSDGVADQNGRALHIPARKITVVERGRDPGTFRRDDDARSSVRGELGIGDDEPLLLNVGRQEFQKGQLVLLAAFERVLDEVPSARLALAGRPGNASSSITSWLADHPAVAARVLDLGHREDVANLMSGADCLVISSHFEGIAGVALEAMGCELPVVSTETAGVRNIIVNDRTALLVPIGDAAEMARAIVALITDQTLAARLTNAAHQDFEQRFTTARYVDRMTALYESVL